MQLNQNQNIIIIPAYNPNEKLVHLVTSLFDNGFNRILVVNDGSDNNCDKYFKSCSDLGAIVLLHAVNFGKGRALKTAFNHCLTSLKPFKSVVTADADGQHLLADIIKVANKSSLDDQSLVLGTRKFNGGDVPFKSWFGNNLTKFIFKLLAGVKVQDTQTGLRGIPHHILPHLLRLSGDGYEYEMNMLIEHRSLGYKFSEVPIETVYIENNKASHFNPFWDSMKIYFLLIRFGMSSFLGASLDFVIFGLTYPVVGVLGGMLIARSFATIVIFTLNKKVVFQDSTDTKTSFLKFVVLVIIFAFIGTAAISGIHNTWGTPIIYTKVFVEISLFLASFSIQRDFIFKSKIKQT